MSNPIIPQFRKVALYLFIVFIAAGALLSIWAILSGDIDEFEIKVIVSTFTIAGCSIFCMCCGAYMEKRRRMPEAAVGISLLLASALFLLLGIWMEIDPEEYWEATAVLSVLGGLLTHMLILLMADLKPSRLWAFVAAGILIGILAVTLCVAILVDDFDEEMFKFIWVEAILVILITIMIPVFSRIDKSELPDGREKIVLTRQADGTFVDREGKIFTLREVLPASSPSGGEPDRAMGESCESN